MQANQCGEKFAALVAAKSGSKEKLYLAVLEAAYRRVRAIDTELDIDHLGRAAALHERAGRTFDFQGSNENFVRLIICDRGGVAVCEKITWPDRRRAARTKGRRPCACRDPHAPTVSGHCII